MKVKILLIISLLYATSGMCQQGIGIHFGGYDFLGPQTGNYLFTSKNVITYAPDNARNDTATHSKLLWQPLVRITYWWKLNKWFDINTGLSLSNLQYPTSSNDTALKNRLVNDVGDRTNRFLGELEGRLDFNIIPRSEHRVSPYIFAGFDASYHNVFWGVDLPVGIGLNIRMDKRLYLNLESNYRLALTSNDQNHMLHSAGLIYWFKPGYRKPTMAQQLAEALPPPDMDKDGVADSVDKCPTIAGLPEFDGCPDTDGDGVPDNMDDCPLVAGSKTFNGCPDTDGDGIPDNTDKCPYVAGPADQGGCPPPDSDHDGVPDNMDHCPDVPGSAANHGCPEIRKEVITTVEKAAHAVYFNEGKATLKKSSYTSLNKIAKVMKDDPTLYVDIAGYTDNTGKPDANLELSDKRANACRDYLIGQGVSSDRITAKGYGDADPVASNKTALGRAQNRRTEFKLRNYK